MLVVGHHVIELRGRLVIPGAPCTTAVHCNRRPLIDPHQDDVRILRIYPDGVIVVAAGSAFPGSEILAAVCGLVRRRVRNVDRILVARRDAYPSEIGAASPHPLFVVDALPTFAGVIGAIDPAFLRRIHHCVDARRITRSDADADAAELVMFPIWETAAKLPPMVATVSRFVETASRRVI